MHFTEGKDIFSFSIFGKKTRGKLGNWTRDKEMQRNREIFINKCSETVYQGIPDLDIFYTWKYMCMCFVSLSQYL